MADAVGGAGVLAVAAREAEVAEGARGAVLRCPAGVADEGVDECCAALEEQLSILSASVPSAVVDGVYCSDAMLACGVCIASW